MKHSILLAFSLAWLICNCVQAQTMKELFVHMPDTLSLVMTDVNRADCVDFLDSNMKARVTNRFNRTSEVTRLTDDYLRAEVTESSVWEMRRLPMGDSTAVICLVKTVKGPVEDSHIRFYSTAWQELPTADYLPAMPSADDFFLTPAPEKADSLKQLRLKAYITFIKASLSPEGNNLSFTYTTPDYMNRDDREKIIPYLRRSPIVYVWRKGRFVCDR